MWRVGVSPRPGRPSDVAESWIRRGISIRDAQVALDHVSNDARAHVPNRPGGPQPSLLASYFAVFVSFKGEGETT